MKTGNFITIFCALLASLSLGQAATQLPLTIETLAGKAEAVVHGKVKGMTCKRDATGRIFTEVQLKLTETLKGKPSGEVFRLVHGGGILGVLCEIKNGQALGLAKRNDGRAVFKRALGQAQPLTLSELKRRIRRAAK